MIVSFSADAAESEQDMGGAAPSKALAAANLVRRSLADFARRMRALRDDHGISASKLSALGRLHRAGRPISASQLARMEGLQPQSVTRILADLDDSGLIVRSRNESDGRQIDIALSEQGRALLTRDARRQNEWLAKVMTERLTPAEQAMLALAADLLDRLAADDPLPAGRAMLSNRGG